MRPIRLTLLLLLIGAAILTLWVVRRDRDHIDHSHLASRKAHSQGGVFVACYREPAHINPFTTSDAVARRIVLRYTHDALLDRDPTTGELRPGIATRYHFDAKTGWLDLRLRAGVTFADGSPVTADDYRFAFDAMQRTQAVTGKLADTLALIADCEVDDPPTRLRLRVRRSWFGIDAKIATEYPVLQRAFFVAACRKLEPSPRTDVDEWDLLRRHLANVTGAGPGTGPYVVQEWLPRQWLRLRQNTGSWQHQDRRSSWNLAGFDLLFVQDRAATMALARRGAIDLLVESDLDSLLASEPQLTSRYRKLVFDQLGSGHFVLLWNHRHKGLARPEVRKALTMSFDRQSIASRLMANQGRISSGWVRPGSDLADPSINALPFDPGAARALLQRSWPSSEAAGRPLRILCASENSLQRRILETAQPALQHAGLQVTIEPLPWATLAQRLRNREFDGALLHMSLDPSGDPYYVFHSGSEAGHNFMGYASAEADAALDSARSAATAAERRQQLRRFHRIFHADQPVTLLAYAMTGVLLHRRIQQADVGALGLWPEAWWIRPEDHR